LDSPGSEQYYRPALQYSKQSVGRFLGTAGGGMKIALINLSHTQIPPGVCHFF
jgi:hypothetical protein